jgi:hypothetical protein
MIERYENIDEKKMEEGLRELMKYRVNQILDHGGPFTLAMAAESYCSTLKMVEWLGINCSEYKQKIKDLEDEINGLEKRAKE